MNMIILRPPTTSNQQHHHRSQHHSSFSPPHNCNCQWFPAGKAMKTLMCDTPMLHSTGDSCLMAGGGLGSPTNVTARNANRRHADRGIPANGGWVEQGCGVCEACCERETPAGGGTH